RFPRPSPPVLLKAAGPLLLRIVDLFRPVHSGALASGGSLHKSRSDQHLVLSLLPTHSRRPKREAALTHPTGGILQSVIGGERGERIPPPSRPPSAASRWV